jgi:hypothetical protein
MGARVEERGPARTALADSALLRGHVLVVAQRHGHRVLHGAGGMRPRCLRR